MYLHEGRMGYGRETSPSTRKWDPWRKASASTKSTPSWDLSSRNVHSREGFGSSIDNHEMSEDVDWLVKMMEERCQINIDPSKPYYIQVQSLRSVSVAYGFENGTQGSAQE